LIHFISFRDRGSVSGCFINEVRVEKSGSQKLYTSDVIRFGTRKIIIIEISLFLDPIEYRFYVELPEGNNQRDDRSDLSGPPVDNKIRLFDENHPAHNFATMDHLQDSLDSDR
jgi:pSer/pThr/pTyr-binding forkhead associated (FHA) protein